MTHMKQHITIEQFEEITDKQKKKLVRWWKGESGDWWFVTKPDISARQVFVAGGLGGIAGMMAEDPKYPLLSIGQMIEYLQESVSGVFSIATIPIQSPNDIQLGLWLVTNYNKHYRKPELCDALWEAVKEVLSENNPTPNR